MPIELTEKFLPYVDEMFTAESKKSLLTNQDFEWLGAHAVRVYKISTSQMNDYNRAGAANGNWSRYGAVAGLDATTEIMTLRKDRSFTFAIDRLDQDETGKTLAAASALARQQREVVIPEVDTYVYGVMTEGAGSKPDALELTKANVYEEILKGSEVLDNAMVSETGRVLVVTPATYTLMKQCTDITMETDIGNDLRLKGVISMLDGMDVVRVPASRLPADFGFMIAHPCATVAPTKLESYKAHEDPPGISGSLVEGRITYDAFVLDNKTKAIYYQRGGLVLTSAAGTAAGATKVTVSTTKGKGNSYKYKVDAAVPVAGADCSAWTDWNGTADITAATGATLVIVEVDGNGLAVKAGSVTVTAKA